MYAAYALSSIMSPTSSLMDMRAAGAIPALISVLNTSKVGLAALCWCSCTAQTVPELPPGVDRRRNRAWGCWLLVAPHAYNGGPGLSAKSPCPWCCFTTLGAGGMQKTNKWLSNGPRQGMFRIMMV